MKAIAIGFTLLILVSVGYTQNLEEYFDQSMYAGWDELSASWQALTNFTLNDTQYGPHKNQQVYLTNITALQTLFDNTNLTVSIDAAPANIVHYVGVIAQYSVSFNYEGKQKWLPKDCNGTQTALFQVSRSGVDVSLLTNGAGKPNYTGSYFQIITVENFTSLCDEPKLKDLVEEAVKEGLRDVFNNLTTSTISKSIQAAYDKYSADYPVSFTYQFNTTLANYSALVNNSLLAVTCDTQGCVHVVDGAIGIPKAPATQFPPFDDTLGVFQTQTTGEFVNETIAAAGADYWFYAACDVRNPNMKSFNFKVADLWVIFPSSEGQWDADDGLEVQCKGAPTAVLCDITNRIVTTSALQCTLFYKPTKATIFDFTTTVTAWHALTVGEGGVGVQIDSATNTAATFSNPMFTIDDRANSILQTLITQGVTAYTQTWYDNVGSALCQVPFLTGDYSIGGGFITIYGMIDPQSARQRTSVRGRGQRVKKIRTK